MNPVNKKTQNIAESATLAVSEKAKLMKSLGKDVISFGVGQPDFPTPENVKNAAKRAIDENFTGYTPSSGIIELKQAIVNKLKRDNNLNYESDQIIVSNGAKHSLHNVFQILLEEGDKVIIPVPYWVSYPEQVKISGGIPVFCKTDEKNKIRSRFIEEKIDDKTKILILNYPSNPTGMTCDKEELEKIADLCVENNIYVVSDEIYEYYNYENKHISIASLNDKIKDLTILINGVSKSYSMTGWRIGYSASNKILAKAMSKLQSQTTSCPCSISQKAAIEAISGDQNSVKIMKDEFEKRKKIMVNLLNDIKGLKCQMPEGAFYCFVDISGTGLSSIDFCNQLLEEKFVACVPGIAFGDDNYIRLSYACSEDTIKKGLTRIKEFCENI